MPRNGPFFIILSKLHFDIKANKVLLLNISAMDTFLLLIFDNKVLNVHLIEAPLLFLISHFFSRHDAYNQ